MTTKKNGLLLAVAAVTLVLPLCGCASDEDNRPVPGTVESTDSKNSENNTPRTNPTPNPEPGTMPGDGPR